MRLLDRCGTVTVKRRIRHVPLHDKSCSEACFGHSGLLNSSASAEGLLRGDEHGLSQAWLGRCRRLEHPHRHRRKQEPARATGVLTLAMPKPMPCGPALPRCRCVLSRMSGAPSLITAIQRTIGGSTGLTPQPMTTIRAACPISIIWSPAPNPAASSVRRPGCPKTGRLTSKR